MLYISNRSLRLVHTAARCVKFSLYSCHLPNPNVSAASSHRNSSVRTRTYLHWRAMSSSATANTSTTATAAPASSDLRSTNSTSSQSSLPYDSVVIFLHGSGGGGSDFYSTLTKFHRDLPHIKWVCPEAKMRPYSLIDGERMQVWFDRTSLEPDCPEDPQGIAESSAVVDAIVQAEMKRGISKSRIIVAGFSQGGCLAYYCAYGRENSSPYAAVLTCGSFLPEPCRLFASDAARAESDKTSIPAHLKSTPLLMMHGERDAMIPIHSHSIPTYDRFQKVLTTVAHVPISNLEHEVDIRVMRQIKQFVSKYLPPLAP